MELWVMTNICYDYFFNLQTEKKKLFWTNKKYAQTENNSWRKISNRNW